MMLSLKENRISSVTVFTDAIDSTLPMKLENKLMSAELRHGEIKNLISDEDEENIKTILEKLTLML